MSSLTLTFYGEIGFSWWGDGVTASDVARKLDAHPDVTTIDVRINSPGGSAFEASAILARLRQHKADVVVHIDGLAASAASVIAMAGDEIRISEGGFVMIHEAAWLVGGRASDHRKAADMLAKLNDTMANIYARRSKLGKDELLAAMDEETWYSAEEAVEAGLADVVVAGAEVAASVAQGRYRRTPVGINVIPMAQKASAPWQFFDQLSRSLANFSPEETNMELSVLISALSLPADSDESAVLQAITKLSAGHTELTGQVEALSADAAEKAATVDKLTAELTELRAAQASSELESKLAALKADGRITDAQADIARKMHRDGHVEAAMNLAASFEDAAPAAPLGKRQSRPDDKAGSNRKPAAQNSDGDIDWHALVAELPGHVRELAGPTLSANPRAFIEANKHRPWAMDLGIDWARVARRKA